MKAHKKEPIAASAPGNPGRNSRGRLPPCSRRGAGKSQEFFLGHLRIHPVSGDDINVIIMGVDKKKWFMLPGHLRVTHPALCCGW